MTSAVCGVKPVAACGVMAVAVLVMHFPVAEEVGKQDWRMRCWPGVFESILETWEAAQEERSRNVEKIVDGASRGLALQR